MDSLRVSFLGRTLPNRFVVKTVVIHVGRQRFYERSEWRDALVVLEQDTTDIECVGGSRTRFAGGPVVCFDPAAPGNSVICRWVVARLA